MNFHHHLIIRSLANELSALLSGKIITSIWSQAKDEVIVEFKVGRLEYFYIKADLTPDISLLSFPNEVKRAKKNTADIFPALRGKTIHSVYSITFDRTLVFELEGNKTLIFKLHAKWSNLICPTENPPLFKNNLKKDLSNPDIFLKSQDYTLDDSLSNLDRMEKIQGSEILQHIRYLFPNYEKEIIKEKIEIHLNFLRFWDNGSLTLTQDSKHFKWSPSKSSSLDVYVTLHLVDKYTLHYIRNWHYEKKIQLQRNEWNTKLKKALKVVFSLKENIKNLESKVSYEQFGNLIMTHLPEIKTGMQAIRVEDYATKELVEIPLKPELTALQNAERFFKKSKNERKELTMSRLSLQKKLKEMEEIESELKILENQTSVNAYDLVIKKEFSKQKIKKTLPFREFIFNEFQILVGKNAKSNEELTFKFSGKNDLWMHARDTSGSHVVIRKKNQKTVPKSVLEYAASIAAYYSGRKTEQLCAVQFTEKKYVRKVKNGAPGQVILEREQVIFVEPYLPTTSLSD